MRLRRRRHIVILRRRAHHFPRQPLALDPYRPVVRIRRYRVPLRYIAAHWVDADGMGAAVAVILGRVVILIVIPAFAGMTAGGRRNGGEYDHTP